MRNILLFIVALFSLEMPAQENRKYDDDEEKGENVLWVVNAGISTFRHTSVEADMGL